MADINKGAVNLPAEISSEIWAKTMDESAVMKLARRIELPGNGVAVPIIATDPVAEWVGETGAKPVSNSTFETKLITPYKLAVIETVSKEFMDDYEALYNELVRRLPGALAKKFDATVFGAAAGKPGDNFDVLGGSTAVDIQTDAWAGLVSADGTIAAAGYELTGWALAPQGKSLLLAARDGSERPLFVNNAAEGAVPMVLGEPVEIARAAYAAGNPNQVGFAGDWDTAVYGTVDGIEISVSDQATLTTGNTTLNLWQNNMVAIRAEIRVGFRVQDANAFVKLTGATTEG